MLSLKNFWEDLQLIKLEISRLRTCSDIRWALLAREDVSNMGNLFESLRDHVALLEDECQKEVESQSRTLKSKIVDIYCELAELFTVIKQQIDVALEWSELHHIISELTKEIGSCSCTIVNLKYGEDAKSRKQDSQSLDLDTLQQSLDLSPVPGCGKLIALSDVDRQNNSELVRVIKKIQPLKVSITHLSDRFSDIQDKLEEYFPSALHQMIQIKYTLEEDWDRLSEESSRLKRDLGEDKLAETLREVARKASETLLELEQDIDKISKIDYECLGSLKDRRDIAHSTENLESKVPEILRILDLLSQNADEDFAGASDIREHYDVLSKRWKDLEHKAGKLDSKFGIYILKYTSPDAFRSSSSRDSVSSVSSASWDFSFKPSRSRPSSAADTASEVSSFSRNSSRCDDCLSFGSEDHIDAATPIVRDSKSFDVLSTPVTSKSRRGDIKARSHSRNGKATGILPPSSIPRPKRPALTRDTFTDPSIKATGGFTSPSKDPKPKRRMSGILQPNFTQPSRKSLASQAPVHSTVRRPSTGESMRRKSEIQLSPTRKSSQVFSTAARNISVNKSTATVIGSTISKISNSVPEPRYAAKTLTALAKEQFIKDDQFNTFGKEAKQSEKQPLSPIAHNRKLTHRASTPNLSPMSRKSSLGNIRTAVETERMPPLPSLPANILVKTQATLSRKSSSSSLISNDTNANRKVYKAPTALSPVSQQKYYIKYGTSSAELQAISGSPVKGIRKSIGTVKEKPRWK
ncbi:hypothetical protein V1511DRAFT_501720 [Dipodascopsis uninucleata]